MKHISSDPGWIKREHRALWEALREERAARRLRASSFADIPPGSIPTASLSNPNAPGFVYLTATNFPVAAAGAAVITQTAAVPPGFSSCVVTVTGRVYAQNPTASSDFLYAWPVVAGRAGNAVPVPVTAGSVASNVAPFATVLSGLEPDTTVTVQVWARTSLADWAAATSNTADIAGSLLWF